MCDLCKNDETAQSSGKSHIKALLITAAVISAVSFVLGVVSAIVVSGKIKGCKAEKSRGDEDFDADEYVQSLNLDD